MKTALINAASSNYVSDELVAKADDMIAKWNDYSIEEALKEVPRKMDASLGQLLGLAVSDQASQKKILTAYLNHPGDQQSFWESLGSISGNKETANKVQHVLKLGSLTANQPILTAALYKRLEKSDNLFYELASMDANEWSKLITDLSTQEKKSIVPAFIEAETESKRVAIYANQMSVVLEQQYPTHSFFGKLAKQPKDASAFAGVKDDMVMFFSNNPSFDLKSSATLKLLSEENAFNFKGIEDKSKLVIELQSAQRLSAYSTDFGTINALKLEGMDSAYNIVEVPQNTFVHKISAAAGSVEKAQLIYNKAEKNFMKSALYWSKLHPNLSFKTTTTPDP
ncbi:MAG: hypothetical protein IPP79_19730 [Chitinophagaceae bacterium]|nr:hypothetical protein [Chitinophagaceae bacterium]